MKKVLMLTILFYLFTFSSTAQTHIWTGNGTNSFWSNPANWDQGTIPLVDGIGTVVIPQGIIVTSTTSINFKKGEIKGGGILINNGVLNIIHDSEINSTKTFSNITIQNSGTMKLFKSSGITNIEPLYLNEGALIMSNNQQIPFEVNGMNISSTTTIPGKIELYSPFLKNGSETIRIDVEMLICCYDFMVEEGTLLIEPEIENVIYGPNFLISENASLILSGTNIFSSSNNVDAAIDGINNGYFEIKNNGTEHPSILITLFYKTEGLLTLKNVTFDGGGTLRIQEADLLITGDNDITLDNVDIWVQPQTGTATLGTGSSFNINLLNGSKIRGSGDFFLDGANLIGSGSGEEQLLIAGTMTVMNSTLTHHFNGLKFSNIGITNLNEGNIILDNNSTFYNHYFQNPEFPELVEFGEVTGSGLFEFPSFITSSDTNNGIFNPSPGTTQLNTVNYAQSNTAKVLIDINGPIPVADFDVIENIGETNFEGAFMVNLNYAPTIGDEFVVYNSNDPLDNCSPQSTTSAIYNGLVYIFDVLCNSNTIILRLGDIVLSVSDFDLKNTFYFNIARNPVSSELLVNFESPTIKAANLELKIYSILGQKAITHSTVSTGTSSVNVSKISSGVYIVQLWDGEKMLATKKFIKQ